MILEIKASAVVVAKVTPQSNIPSIPGNGVSEVTLGGVKSRSGNELVSQVEGLQSSKTNGLVAQIENTLQWEGRRPRRRLLPAVSVRLEFPLAFLGPAGPPWPFGWRCAGCC